MEIAEEVRALIQLELGLEATLGYFPEKTMDTYIVLTPLSENYPLYGGNKPIVDLQQLRISIFSKSNYGEIRKKLVNKLVFNNFTITLRHYVGYEKNTGYHNYAVDVAKDY